MIKLIGSLFLVVSGTMAGCMASHKLTRRVQFLSQYIKFISFCETQIRFSAIPIIEILRKQQSTNDFSPFIEGCVKKMEDGKCFSDAWWSSLKDVERDFGLTVEDINLIRDFGTNLGESDVEGQISLCRLNIKLMGEVLNSACESKEKKGRIYVMLGVFSGVAITLIIC